MSNFYVASGTTGRGSHSYASRRPWRAVFSVALSASVFCSSEFLPVGLLRFVSAGLHVSDGVAGTMVTVPGFLAALAAPLLTVAIRNQDRRRVLLALAMLLVLSNLLGLFAPNFPVLLLGRALFGIGIGGFWAIGAGLGARLVPAESAGKATSIIFAGVSIGMLVGGSAGAFIGELFGWRTAFGVSLLLSLISLAAQALYLPALRVNEGVTARGLLGITRTRNGRVGLLAMLLALVGQYATYTYITPLLASDAGYDGKTISLILLGYTVVGMVGNFVGGATSGRHLKSTLGLTIVFCALPAALLPFLASAHIELLIVLAVWGIAYGAMPVALQMWMARAAPKASEGAMALFVSNFQISISLGSFLGGLVVDYQGLRSAMFFGAIVGAVGFVVLWLGARGEAPDEENDPRSKSFESTRRQSGARA